MRHILLFTFFVLQSLIVSAQYEWEQKASLPDNGRERVFSFMIEDVIYVGGGRIGGSNTDEFWAYDINTDTWEQKADYPGGAIRNAVGFAIGEYGYAGLGYTGTEHSNRFWKYDPSDDSWIQISSPFPFSTGVSFATGISNDEYGFICFGGDSITDTYTDGIWRYDPVSDSWNFLTTLPSYSRWGAIAHIIDNKIYIGGGGRLSFAFDDFWLYDLDTDSWSQLADIPTNFTLGSMSFVFDSKIVLVKGSWGLDVPGSPYLYPAVYIYDISSANWEPGPLFPVTPRFFGFSHSHESGGFVGLGRHLSSPTQWEGVYRFSDINTAIEELYEDNTTIFPNPATDKVQLNTPYTLSHLEIYNQEGKLLKTQYQENGHREVDLSEFSAGTYFLILGDKDRQKIISKKIIKH